MNKKKSYGHRGKTLYVQNKFHCLCEEINFIKLIQAVETENGKIYIFNRRK